ncbi:MAG: hypothetical protein Kow0022_09970 [Phycisphaerales bacterium]
MPDPLALCALVAIQSNDPLAGLDKNHALEALAAGGTLLGLLLTIVFFIWLAILGVLLPWFAWRTKVYTKRQYLLSKRLLELMHEQAMRASAHAESQGDRHSRSV